MLLYIIPFVLLLVIAIILKKREASNQDTSDNKTSKKVSNKKTAKKNVAKTARTSQRQPTQVVEEPATVQETAVEVNKDLKQKIDNLIKEKNYSAAEAQINLALNQDNRQHGLYLSLLDIHFAQKDEFAVNQLLQFLRSLGLDDIVKQGEEKQATISKQNIEVIEFASEQSTTTPSITPLEKNPVPTDAFDSLVDHKPTSNSFDLLQNEYSATKKPEEETNQPVESATKFDDLAFTSSTPTLEKPHQVEETTETATTELEFNLTQAEQTPQEPQTQAHEALDFTFGLDSTAPTNLTNAEASPSVSEDTTKALEFSFDATPTITEKAPDSVSSTETLTEFKMEFDTPITPAVSTPAAVEAVDVTPTLEFKLDTQDAAPQSEFSFDLADSTTAQSLDVQSGNDIQLSETSTPDPLAQAFPDLLESNEITLNLDLAEQYIELGAYDAARELLTQNQESYSTEQKLQSESLLNRIAS